MGTTKKWSFPLRISAVNVTNSAWNCDLVTFTEEILMENLIFRALQSQAILLNNTVSTKITDKIDLEKLLIFAKKVLQIWL